MTFLLPHIWPEHQEEEKGLASIFLHTFLTQKHLACIYPKQLHERRVIRKCRAIKSWGLKGTRAAWNNEKEEKKNEKGEEENH
jgi:hypothetical protein